MQKLIEQLEDPLLTEEQWRAIVEKARPLIDELEFPELIEPFVLAGDRRRWA